MTGAGAARASLSQHPATPQASSNSDFEDYVLQLQSSIISKAESMDGSGQVFRQDRWQRDETDPNAGYGITAVLEDGDLLEKAASNVSIISGVLTPTRAAAMSSRGRDIDPSGGQPYSAMAMSLVFHPRSPWVPTLRADVRVFEVDGQKWFGGGCDLTPVYLFEDDAREFHTFWKALCDRSSSRLYPEYKSWCDRYFYIPARKEHRGVGGIFFDDLGDGCEMGFDVEQFIREVGDGILPSWENIVKRRRHAEVTEKERNWQLVRRGRYLEFNLLYDRGVKFGLDGGRVESIMVSAPPLIAWKYDVQPEAGSQEEATLAVLRQPRAW
eukprot:CAMPEP_0117658452 /NCGR_PEP_ID=MMETSP0804-20121206/5871_1 /TAXON_ID=1074897 /ORGANISM="Tetraselmis astigmatica, Strain CCMP880" /LENGTH=325 /DNA_ID=CAMNT_0005464973 /DNA_START=84 /DNA_END=1058 /DNA_ORIENTATION=-